MIISNEVKNRIIKDHIIQFGIMIFVFIVMNFILKDIYAFTVFYGTVILYFVSNFYNPKKYLTDILIVNDTIELQYLSSYFRTKNEVININKIEFIKFNKSIFFGNEKDLTIYLNFNSKSFIIEGIQTQNKLDVFIKNNNIELKK